MKKKSDRIRVKLSRSLHSGIRYGLNQVENIILYNGPNNGQVLLSVEVKL